MEFRLLGPLDARDDGRSIALGGQKQRALLARLLLDANRTVAVERLIDDLWGEEVPATAAKMVQIYVSRLRKLLPDGMLTTRPPGYAIEVDPERIDLVRFERLREQGAEALAAGQPARASERLAAALALWRGPALAEFDEPFAAAERARLEELQLACLEQRIEADLAAGARSGIDPELDVLIARHPLRERLRALRMLALYRAGRQSEALDTYRDYRATLADELGIEPSQQLRELERRMLQQDPSLEPSTGAVPASAPPADVRYVRSGDVAIAYQVVGDGPLDLVLVHGWICSFQPAWERPQIARFYRRLAGLGRLILFDKRGTGLSDRVHGIAPLEERIDDVRAVMDAAGSQRAVLVGISEGGPMSALFAATHPERTMALVAIGTFARRAVAGDYAIDVPSVDFVAEEWGVPMARRWLEQRAPSVAGDEEAVRWYASYFMRSASPGAALAVRAMNRQVDVRPILGSIRVPALVLYRAREYLRAATRYMGERIPHARLVELPGVDHLPWEGDQEAVLAEIERFVTALGTPVEPDRILTTVLCTQAVEPDREPDAHAAVVADQLARFRGRRLARSGSCIYASFDGAARAVRCACTIVTAAQARRIALRAGLHTGECEVAPESVGGPAPELARAIAAAAGPGQVLVSSTVRDLVPGSGLIFGDERAVVLDTAGERREWSLFAVPPQR